MLHGITHYIYTDQVSLGVYHDTARVIAANDHGSLGVFMDLRLGSLQSPLAPLVLGLSTGNKRQPRSLAKTRPCAHITLRITGPRLHVLSCTWLLPRPALSPLSGRRVQLFLLARNVTFVHDELVVFQAVLTCGYVSKSEHSK